MINAKTAKEKNFASDIQKKQEQNIVKIMKTSIWHKRLDPATANRAILAICGVFIGSRAMVFENRPVFRSWYDFVDEYKLEKWAYIEDLLHKTE